MIVEQQKELIENRFTQQVHKEWVIVNEKLLDIPCHAIQSKSWVLSIKRWLTTNNKTFFFYF